MWLDDEALGSHFEWVKESMSSGSSGDDSEWEDIPAEQNELTAGIRRNR